MKTKYFSGAQAVAINRDYQHLAGRSFGTDDGAPTNRTISLITISPYSRILQWSFARLVAKGKTPADAMMQWPLDRFDVVLLSFDPARPGDFLLKDLRSYLEETGQPFDLTRYRRSAIRHSPAKAA